LDTRAGEVELVLRIRKLVPSKWEREITSKLKKQHVCNLVEIEELERKVLSAETWWFYHYSTGFSAGLKEKRKNQVTN